VRRISLALVVCAGALTLAPHALAAGTTVSVSGTTATITVNVDVVVGDRSFTESDISDKFRASFETTARNVETYWNQAFAGHLYRGCTRFQLQLNLRVLPGSEAHWAFVTEDYIANVTSDGHHVMEWMETEWGGSSARPVVFDPYEPKLPATADFASPYTHDLDGDWSPDMKSDRDYAHEVGHLMGLGDDYNDHGSVAGRAGTLMDGGDAIDQNLVNRIGNIIKKAGIKLPSCWTGTIESDTSRVYLEGIYGGHTHCTDRWRGTLEFGIAADGKIEGNGEAHLLSKPTCYAGVGKVATLETFVVRGRATDKELTLELAFDTGNGVSYAGWSANDAPYNGSSHPELVGPPLSVPRTDPCTAAGTVTVHDKLPSGGKLDPLTATDRIALKCPRPGST